MYKLGLKFVNDIPACVFLQDRVGDIVSLPSTFDTIYCFTHSINRSGGYVQLDDSNSKYYSSIHELYEDILIYRVLEKESDFVPHLLGILKYFIENDIIFKEGQ